MPPIHISDHETDKLVRRLAARRSVSLTEAIKLAVGNELAKDDVEEMPTASDKPQVGDTDNASLERDLDAVMRSTTLDYIRLRAKQRGTKGVGSRVYQMLARHGSVETLRRLVNRPPDGLDFLNSIDKLELSAEEIALAPRYNKIIDEDIRARALANLRKIGRRRK
jgi:hypothetical protein